MKHSLEFPSRITNGKLDPKMSEKIAALLRTFEGKTVVISIAERKKPRGGQANRYYWGVVVSAVTAMFRENGTMVDADDTHSFLKEHVGKMKQNVVLPDGEVVKVLGSTTKLSTSEFAAYINEIRRWALEFGLNIPSPGEYESTNQEE